MEQEGLQQLERLQAEVAEADAVWMRGNGAALFLTSCAFSVNGTLLSLIFLHLPTALYTGCHRMHR